MKNTILKYLWVATVFGACLVAVSPAGAADVPLPDVLIGKVPRKKIGNNTYSTTGVRQTVGIRAKRSGKAKFYFTGQNDNIVGDNIVVKASRKNKKFVPKYFQTSPARRNVTALLTGRGHDPGLLASGASASYRAQIKAKRKYRDRRAKRTFFVRVAAVGASPDLGKAKVKKKP